MAKKTVKRRGSNDPAVSRFRALQHVIETGGRTDQEADQKKR
jgi:hypothetical protein